MVTDGEIIKLLEEDDLKGYEMLFKKYYMTLWNCASSIVKNNEEAQDIIQQLFVKICEKNLINRQIDNLEMYLRYAVKNECLNFLKKEKRRHEILTFSDFRVEERTPLNFLENQQLQNELKNAIASLPLKCRLIFESKYLKGLTYQQIAEKECISVKTVDNHLSKALKLLRNKLVLYGKEFSICIVLLFQ